MEVGFYNQDTPFLTTELQSKWLAHVLSGKVLLPTEEEMMSDVENYYHHMEETGVPKSFTHVLPPNEVLHLFSYLSNLIFLTTQHLMKPFLFWCRKSNWVLHPISNIWSSLDNLYGNKAIDFWWKHFHLFPLSCRWPPFLWMVWCQIEYRNWLLAQVEMPPLKEWRGRMYRECVKFAKAKPDGYRDQWDDDYWDAVIASQVDSTLPKIWYLSSALMCSLSLSLSLSFPWINLPYCISFT